MRGFLTTEGEFGEKILCDICEKKVDEAYLIEPEDDEDERLIAIRGGATASAKIDDINLISVCENCLHNQLRLTCFDLRGCLR